MAERNIADDIAGGALGRTLTSMDDNSESARRLRRLIAASKMVVSALYTLKIPVVQDAVDSLRAAIAEAKS